LHGPDIQTWTVPAHDVLLEALTGASAGGICAAISSIALKEEFDHIRQTNPPPGVAVNRLYQSWVRSIDIVPLLGTVDLPNNEGPVHSILDSTPIENIAKATLLANPGRAKARPWVVDPLAIILTLSNLRGVPYSVVRFMIANRGTVSTLALNYSDPADPTWKTLQTAAMATGSFPIMLASRVIERTRADYENRSWEIDN
jgi:hypothetical protein